MQVKVFSSFVTFVEWAPLVGVVICFRVLCFTSCMATDGDEVLDRLGTAEHKMELLLKSLSAIIRVLRSSIFSRAAGVAEQLSDNDGSSLGCVVSSSVGRVPSQGFSGGQGSKSCASEALSVIRAGKRG